MADIEALAQRVEREEPSRELWREAFYAVGGESRMSLFHFDNFLYAGAYRDAAAMLMPKGWRIETMNCNSAGDDAWVYLMIGSGTGRHAAAKGLHAEARARCAAALRANAVGKEGQCGH